VLRQIFDSTVDGLHKQLSLTMRRNEAISSNISNAETPKYRAVDLNFGSELAKAFDATKSELRVTNTKHMDMSSSSGAFLMQDFSGATKADGNNVDVDIQMGKLVYNSSKYSAAASILREKFRQIHQIIREAV
jgi:flagellar basal-body rod protein FlgB